MPQQEKETVSKEKQRLDVRRAVALQFDNSQTFWDALSVVVNSEEYHQIENVGFKTIVINPELEDAFARFKGHYLRSKVRGPDVEINPDELSAAREKRFFPTRL